jgi:Protein of unknown function (DUF1236)
VRHPLLFATMVLGFISSIGLAAAQVNSPGTGGDTESGATSQPSEIKLAPSQRIAILYAVLRNSGKIAAPANFQAVLGGRVPPSVELYVLPSDTQSPQARGLKYTMVQNQVVLVDPTTMRVVDIIRQ